MSSNAFIVCGPESLTAPSSTKFSCIDMVFRFQDVKFGSPSGKRYSAQE